MAVNEYGAQGGDRTLLIYRSKADRTPFMLDVVLEPEVARGVDVSPYPQEDGSESVDHARNRPVQFRFRGLFVNEPADDGEAQRRSDATIAPDPNSPLSIAERLLGRDFRDPLVSSRVLGPQVDEKRAADLFAELAEIMRARKPVKIAVDGIPFTDFLMTDLTRRPLKANAIEVSGAFREVRYASRLGVELKPIPAPPRKSKTTATTREGPKAKAEAAPEQKTKATSILLKAAQLLGAAG